MRQIRFTKEGYKKLKKEYDDLSPQRILAVEDLKKSRELGDLSENGYYKASRAKLSSIDRRLRQFSSVLKQSIIVKRNGASIIGIGNKVVVSDGKKETTYHIVGDLEADSQRGKISMLSPLGKAIAGKRVGNTITLDIAAGKINYKIIKIS